jgi:hypothetical protein
MLWSFGMGELRECIKHFLFWGGREKSRELGIKKRGLSFWERSIGAE